MAGGIEPYQDFEVETRIAPASLEKRVELIYCLIIVVDSRIT